MNDSFHLKQLLHNPYLFIFFWNIFFPFFLDRFRFSLCWVIACFEMRKSVFTTNIWSLLKRVSSIVWNYQLNKMKRWTGLNVMKHDENKILHVRWWRAKNFTNLENQFNLNEFVNKSCWQCAQQTDFYRRMEKLLLVVCMVCVIISKYNIQFWWILMSQEKRKQQKEITWSK